jgi:hypothetical protein
MDIRIRQNTFLIIDKIYNKIITNETSVSSGSLAEGLDLPGSDIDIMFVLNTVQVIQNVQQMNRSARKTTLLAKDDMEFPGFSRLKLIAEGDHKYAYTLPECFVETINGLFLSNNSFVRKFNEKYINFKSSVHGPCLSDIYATLEVAFCFHFHKQKIQNNTKCKYKYKYNVLSFFFFFVKICKSHTIGDILLF